MLDSDQVKQIMYYMSQDIFIMEKEGKGYNDTYIVPVLTDETALSYACMY